MSLTLEQILTDANATLDLTAALPTGDELTLRRNYANQAVQDASAVAQFSEFTVTQDVATPSTTTSLTTVPLSTNQFREFEEIPTIQGEPNDQYEQIKAKKRVEKNPADRYCYVLGNPQEGYNAVFNYLTPNKTLCLTYQRYPSGMATLSQICELPDATFVTRKIEEYVLYSRGDERFPIAKAQAEKVLLNMVGRESKTPGGGTNTTQKPYNPLSYIKAKGPSVIR
jgi:hypothetical protein